MDGLTEKIGNVTLNYKFYKGTDTYSDGDIEDKLLDIVKNEKDIQGRLKKEKEWPLLYHLSDVRKNVLNWYDLKKDGSLLEIGAGCGAISGLFCERVSRVAAIDLSKRRSTINAYRNKEHDNLEIYVGNFEDIQLEEKFDYVSLIGVLEYSIYYIDSDQPFLDMLKKAKSYLKPGGKLLVAIENKYGLKYWAGAKEDHTGEMFDSITGYANVERVRTFSKDQLYKLVEEVGFVHQDFYYPMPDYKLPFEVYSQEYLPKSCSDTMIGYTYDRDKLQLFDEKQAWDSICKDGKFEEFANSFIVIAES